MHVGKGQLGLNKSNNRVHALPGAHAIGLQADHLRRRISQKPVLPETGNQTGDPTPQHLGLVAQSMQRGCFVLRNQGLGYQGVQFMVVPARLHDHQDQGADPIIDDLSNHEVADVRVADISPYQHSDVVQTVPDPSQAIDPQEPPPGQAQGDVQPQEKWGDVVEVEHKLLELGSIPLLGVLQVIADRDEKNEGRGEHHHEECQHRTYDGFVQPEHRHSGEQEGDRPVLYKFFDIVIDELHIVSKTIHIQFPGFVSDVEPGPVSQTSFPDRMRLICTWLPTLAQAVFEWARDAL
mmetsp:Transcript_12664/g.31483  ORF Transcript_12664/g.31483 Transcript_12664/m.31483 type:complete len:293 (-) Transcript_12664:8-886(-)